MELKKSAKAKLDKYGNLFVFIGFLLMSWLSYAVINWKQTTIEKVYQTQEIVYEPPAKNRDIIEIERPVPDKPKKVVERPKPQIPDIVEPVDDTDKDTKPLSDDIERDLPPPPTPNLPPTDIPVVQPTDQKPSKADIKKVKDEISYTKVYQKPVVPGCENKKGKELDRCNDRMIRRELNRWLEYPEEALEERRMGTVFVKFIIDITGDITDVKLLRTSKSQDLDEAALEGVSRMFRSKRAKKRIKPGKTITGKPVKVKYMVPVVFRVVD